MLLIQKEYQERLTVILLTEVYQEIEGKRLPNSFKASGGQWGPAGGGQSSPPEAYVGLSHSPDDP